MQNEIQQLESAIAETKKAIQKRERWMREGHSPIDLETLRIQLFEMRKALQRLQGKL